MALPAQRAKLLPLRRCSRHKEGKEEENALSTQAHARDATEQAGHACLRTDCRACVLSKHR